MKKPFIYGSFRCSVLLFGAVCLNFPVACGVESGGSKETFEIPLDSKPLEREDSNYLTSYAPVLKEAKRAVVAVHTARIVRVIRAEGYDPREEMLRRFFGLPSPRGRGEARIEERRLPQGLGSGVVISPDGYVLTNHHVIAVGRGGVADEVLVKLNDRRELRATVVGVDVRSDLAVLKVDAEGLPHLSVADSDLLEVGDIVFAIGNPMGVGLTVTQGIVSALDRSDLSILGEAGYYERFIQTDAAINPGNSGGALVDAYGRLVGINTAILSQSGGSIGIGFAIPSSFARHVATSLVRQGEVRRAILGVRTDTLTPEYIEAFKAPVDRGVLVQSVVDGLPAARAGIRKGDIIVSINGESIEDTRDLRLKIAELAPGETVEAAIYRMGVRKTIRVELADSENPHGGGASTGALLSGIQVAVIDDARRAEFGLNGRTEGLVVLSVAEDSPYALALPAGAVVVSINGKRPESVDEGVALLRSRKTSHAYVDFNGRGRYVSLTVD